MNAQFKFIFTQRQQYNIYKKVICPNDDWILNDKYSKQKRVIDRKLIWTKIIVVYEISFEFAPNELLGHSSSHKIFSTNFAVNLLHLGGCSYGNWFHAECRMKNAEIGEGGRNRWITWVHVEAIFVSPGVFLMLIFLPRFFFSIILLYQQQMQLISVEISLL